MPRVSKEQTDLNRVAIEEASARLFREQGINGVSVNELMAAAGLTHGGFYGHFESKDALAAAACERAFSQSTARWEKRIAAAPDGQAALASIVQGYLSRTSRDAPGSACPVAALAGDVAREPTHKPVRAAYATGLKSQLQMLESQLGSGDAAADRAQALTLYASLVGAMVLARATDQDALSDELLDATRAQLLAALE